MDELLKQNPSQLSDERREMFALADRFSAAVKAYQRQYVSIAEKKNKDLQQRSLDKKNHLDRLRELQESERRRLSEEYRKAVESIDRQIASWQSQTSEALRMQEKRLTAAEREERTALNCAHNADEARLKKDKETRKRIGGVLSDVDILLGKTLRGGSRFKKICYSLEKPRINIAGKAEALEAVEKSVVDEAQSTYDTIKDITESLLKKVIFYKKRTACIKKLLEIDTAAREAILWMESENRKEEEKRRKDSDERCAQLRAECSRNRQEIVNKKNDAVSLLQKKRGQADEQYQESSARMAAGHKGRYEEQEKYYSAQMKNAAAQWQAELDRCSRTFASQMEEEFPAARMNQWLSQFWLHPRNVEDYSKAGFPQLNTLIGMASIDISGWYKGGTGAVIRQVLKNYSGLFGVNQKQAERAYREAKIYLPYTISIEEGTSLLISYDDGSDERAKTILNAIGMRLLRSAPPCQMRFQLIDADGIGTFGRLMSLDPSIANNPSEPTVKSFAIGEGGQVHSTKEDIASQIAETKITMDDLSRQLTNYSSIREFNQSNPLSRQIYRPVLMMNFPLGLGEGEIRTLSAMAADCSRWGFSMILAQPDKAIGAVKQEIQANVGELRKNVLCVRMDTGHKGLRVIQTDSVTERNAEIFLYGLPDQHTAAAIAKEIRRDSVEASRVLIRFTEAKGVCPDRGQWFRQKADDGIVVPVGYLEGGQPFKLQFDDQHVHAVIMGNTGSGKTNLLHVLMTNIMLRYAPEEIMIYLIDFKYGLDFRMYTQYNLPNFRTISINNDPEFALAMLQNLEKEQQERSILMGSRYQKISEYNAANPGKRLNRILLVIDELYELAKQASDDVQKSILKKIDSFAHQTRAFGIHMAVCGQDLDKIENFETIKNQCTTRLALHCGDEQVRMLMDDAGAARMHTIDTNDQGACVFSLSNGSNPQIEHTAYLEAAHQEKLLEQIHRHYLNKKQITKVKVLLTRVSDDPNHLLQMFLTTGYIPDLTDNRILIGEPISMEREFNLCLSENLWVAGGGSSDEAMDAGNSIMFFSALSLLLAKLKCGQGDIVCTNCSDQPMRDIEEEERDLAGQLMSMHPQFFQYRAGERYREVLNQMLDELEARRSQTKPCSRALWWFLIRPEIVNGVGDDSTMVIDLKELLNHGAQYNIHTILWNADIKKAQKLQIDRTLFRDRICLDMSAEDSRIVNGNELRPAPEGFKAVFIGNNTMRFRVYDLPDGKWMNGLFARLKDAIS